MSDEPTGVAWVVCLGACTLAGGKPGIHFKQLNAEGELADRAIVFDRKSKVFGGATVGSVYELKTSEGGSTFHAPMKWLRAWSDENAVLVWKTAHDNLIATERAAKNRKAGEQEALDAALATLDPLRHLYHRTDGPGRNILIAQVISFMQRNPFYDGQRPPGASRW